MVETTTHSCQVCTFVGSVEDIKVTPEIEKQINSRPIYLGAFVWPGCRGHLHCYALKCPECGKLLVDYPHGYTSIGELYFACYNCSATPKNFHPRRTVIVVEDREIYKRDSIEYPPTHEEHIKKLKKLAKKCGLKVGVMEKGYPIILIKKNLWFANLRLTAIYLLLFFVLVIFIRDLIF